MTPRPLTGPDTKMLVAAVADEPDPQESRQHTVILVGGSLLAWRDLRASTVDVDSARRLDEELRRAVARVAVNNDLAPDWLNSNAAAFPTTFEPEVCEVLFDHPRLLVFAAPLRDVFITKMCRADPNDVADMIVM